MNKRAKKAEREAKAGRKLAKCVHDMFVAMVACHNEAKRSEGNPGSFSSAPMVAYIDAREALRFALREYDKAVNP